MAALAKATLLSSLKASQLKHLAFLTGLGQTGTKPELERCLTEHIQAFQPRHAASKLVSVDMGLRNLAVCTMLVPPTLSSPSTSHLLDPSTTSPITGSTTPTLLTVTSWRRNDLLAQPSPSAPPDASSTAGPFHPSTLARLAHTVCTTQLLAAPAPAHVLIERQRFRTRGGFGGRGAVAEWTLRVNTFEAMLWACLTTLSCGRGGGGVRGSDGWDGVVSAVSPDRVVAFWLALVVGAGGVVGQDGGRAGRKGRRMAEEEGDEGGGTPDLKRLARAKLEKKDRVAIVRRWAEGNGVGAEFGGVRLDFEGQAAETAEAFRSGKARAADGGKLDDLADCLLQAVAWMKWEENRNAIRNWLTRAQR